MSSLTGTVTSKKIDKSATVTVVTKWQHPMYKKILKRSKNYLCHDTLGAAIQDKVRIKPIKPVSKKKRHQIIEIIKS